MSTNRVLKLSMYPDAHVQQLPFYEGARFVSAAVKAGGPTVDAWAVVDKSARTATVNVLCIGTGWDMPPGEWSHVGTAVTIDGFVFHVFVEPEYA